MPTCSLSVLIYSILDRTQEMCTNYMCTINKQNTYAKWYRKLYEMASAKSTYNKRSTQFHKNFIFFVFLYATCSHYSQILKNP